MDKQDLIALCGDANADGMPSEAAVRKLAEVICPEHTSDIYHDMVLRNHAVLGATTALEHLERVCGNEYNWWSESFMSYGKRRYTITVSECIIRSRSLPFLMNVAALWIKLDKEGE